MNNMLSKEQLEKIANPVAVDVGGTQNPIVTEMAIELLSLREQLAELKALPPFAYAFHRDTGVMWFAKDKPMCSEFDVIPLFTAAKPGAFPLNQ